jgi:AraC-like DNA-binding protein
MRFPQIDIILQGNWKSRPNVQHAPRRFVLHYELDYHQVQCGTIHVNGVRIPIYQNTVTFVRPGDIKSSHMADGMTANINYTYFNVSDDPGGRLQELLQKIPNGFLADEHTQKLFERLFEESGGKRCVPTDLKTHTALLTLLIHLSSIKSDDQSNITTVVSQHQTTLFSSLQYMQEHIGETLNVAAMAEHIGYSASHFNHLFKTYTKRTPYAYFLSLKIQEAENLLLNTNLSISAIAERLGFSNVSKFTVSFKNETGIPPGQFRKKRDGVQYRG